MNTKTFAQHARKILIKGVQDKFRYWGFDAKGDAHEEPQPVSGGYLFRGQAYDDPAVPVLWNSLRSAVRLKGLDTVVEEAAYTWFNRIMAVYILAKNGYEPAQLEFALGAGRLPLILQRAQRGTYPFLNADEKERLQRIIADHTIETETFAILLIGYCHSHTLLQTVFGGIDDYTELLLPDNILAEDGFLNLLNTTDAISDDEYRKVELIGWLYQFYISEKKDEVFAGFKKNKKAEAEDIPAATQIFTPNWIVKYMVQNTVGKLWLDLHPDSPLKADMKYLVEGDNPEYGNPIITEVVKLKLLDPAVGSGHILVEAFDLLYDMYMAEYYPPEEAVESILQHNLFGLDIDKRAAQLAQFALLLKAASRRPEILKRGLRPHIYAMPEPRSFGHQEVLDFLGKDGLAYADKLLDALQLMQQAKNLGSIMQFDLPEAGINYIDKRWLYFQEAQDLGFHERALLPALSTFLPVLLILCKKYEAVVANPPYMGQGNMNGDLKDYINHHYTISKSDLMTVFMEVGIKMLIENGQFGMINLPSWMFLSSYETLRKKLLKDNFISSLIHNGRGVFGSDFGSVSFCIEKKSVNSRKGVYRRLFKNHVKVDSVLEKEVLFLNKDFGYFISDQTFFSKIPGTPIAYWLTKRMISKFENKKIESICSPRTGMSTSDNERFLRAWFELKIDNISFNTLKHLETKSNAKKWYPVQRGGGFRKWYGLNTDVVNWENDGKEIKDYAAQLYKSYSRTIKNISYYFREGISWSYITSGSTSFRTFPSGNLILNAGPACYFDDSNYRAYTLGFLNSKLTNTFLKILTPTINFDSGPISKIPFILDVEKNGLISDYVKNNVSIATCDWNSRETSWDFQYSQLLNRKPNLRLSYETWQSEVIQDFFQLHANEEDLNRIFIDIYGLQDEITPEVLLKDITILQEELDGKDLEALEPQFRAQGKDSVALPIKRDVVMQQLLSYFIGLCMGRYRLDKPGLHIAHPNTTAAEIAPYHYNGQEVEIDEDAILPLMGTACEFPDDALLRIKGLLDVIWGADTRTDNLNFMQECLDQDLEKYLVKQFWKDHCRRYKKKPIYWLFSSPGGAFQVLVYMHRMNAFTVERIRDKYLLPHIKHLRGKLQLLESRKALLNSQESRQLDRLRNDLSECEAYELQLKDVADRQLVFDLDDGVTENYKLFEGVVKSI